MDVFIQLFEKPTKFSKYIRKYMKKYTKSLIFQIWYIKPKNQPKTNANIKRIEYIHIKTCRSRVKLRKITKIHRKFIIAHTNLQEKAHIIIDTHTHTQNKMNKNVQVIHIYNHGKCYSYRIQKIFWWCSRYARRLDFYSC